MRGNPRRKFAKLLGRTMSDNQGRAGRRVGRISDALRFRYYLHRRWSYVVRVLYSGRHSERLIYFSIFYIVFDLFETFIQICFLFFFQPSITRLYRVHAAGASIHLEPVPICIESLDSGYVFVLDTGNKIFMWYGKKAKSTLKSKARLMAEKINKNERKNKAEILTETMNAESEEFLQCLGLEEDEQKDRYIVVSIVFCSIIKMVLYINAILYTNEYKCKFGISLYVFFICSNIYYK